MAVGFAVQRWLLLPAGERGRLKKEMKIRGCAHWGGRKRRAECRVGNSPWVVIQSTYILHPKVHWKVHPKVHPRLLPKIDLFSSARTILIHLTFFWPKSTHKIFDFTICKNLLEACNGQNCDCPELGCRLGCTFGCIFGCIFGCKIRVD